MFGKIFKFKNIVLGLILILVMILSYPIFESVLFATSKWLTPWKYRKSTTNKDQQKLVFFILNFNYIE